jgi:1-acyl-sn-glycerol-3-phosphate acyltransferase
MTGFLKQLHRIYSLIIIFILSFLFYPFYYLASRSPKSYGLLNRLRVWHSQLSCICIGIRLRYTYEVPLSSTQQYIYCANHSSNLDIMILCILGKRHFHFMAKDELQTNPVLRIFFNTIDIAVNRESKISAFRAFKRAGVNLQSGMSLMIFPEGRIDDDNYPPQLLPFKNGPFRLAIENNVPIVPVTICNAWNLMWDDGRKKGTRPGSCDIYIHKPIFTQGLNVKEDEALKDQVYALMESKLRNT